MNLARNGPQIVRVPMETQLVLGDSLGGGLGGREGADTRVPVADWCWCVAETSTTL